MNHNLTIIDAFSAMRNYLEAYYERTSSDDIACILSDTQFFSEGETADPAAWQDWINAVSKTLKEKNQQN